MGSGGYNLVSLEVTEWMNQLLDQDQDLGFPLGKGQGKKLMQEKIQTTIKEIDTKMFSGSLSINCLICSLYFRTENGWKVHMNLVHFIPPDLQDELNCKYWTLEYSDLNYPIKNIKWEHKNKCKECFKTFTDNKEEISHMNENNHLRYHRNNILTPTSGATSLDTAPRIGQGSGGT